MMLQDSPTVFKKTINGPIWIIILITLLFAAVFGVLVWLEFRKNNAFNYYTLIIAGVWTIVLVLLFLFNQINIIGNESSLKIYWRWGLAPSLFYYTDIQAVRVQTLDMIQMRFFGWGGYVCCGGSFILAGYRHAVAIQTDHRTVYVTVNDPDEFCSFVNGKILTGNY